MNYRAVNIISAVLAAGIAVGSVTAHNCGSVKEVALQSPSLLGSEAVSFEELFYGQDLQAEDIGYIPVSMGNFDINDYTIVAVASYSDIASEYGTDPSDPIVYDGSTYWIIGNTVLVSQKTDSDAEGQGEEGNDRSRNDLKTGDAVTRISHIGEWSLVKLENGQQGYIMNSHLSDTEVDPDATVTPTPVPEPDDEQSSSSQNNEPVNSNTYDDDDDDNDDVDDDDDNGGGDEPEPDNNNSNSSSGNDYEEYACDFTVYSSCALNTRTGPGISYTLLSTLATGTAIDVVAKTDNGWYKSSSGYYVKASFTQDNEPTPTPAPQYYDDDDDDDDDDYWSDFAKYVRSFIGCRYVYGGASPDGFDCSGFVMYCYANYYGISLPHGATSQSYRGEEVDPDYIQVGDIICFDKNEDGIMEHSALYVGHDTYVHAQSSATGVVESSYSSAYGIATVRRVL